MQLRYARPVALPITSLHTARTIAVVRVVMHELRCCHGSRLDDLYTSIVGTVCEPCPTRSFLPEFTRE